MSTTWEKLEKLALFFGGLAIGYYCWRTQEVPPKPQPQTTEEIKEALDNLVE